MHHLLNPLSSLFFPMCPDGVGLGLQSRRVTSAWARSAAVWSRRSCASFWIAPSALMLRGEMIQIPLSQCNPSCVTMIGPSEATWLPKEFFFFLMEVHGFVVLGCFGLKRVNSTRPLSRGKGCVGILRWWFDAFYNTYILYIIYYIFV